jgi:formamidopyrimidine-DNA glycosylase
MPELPEVQTITTDLNKYLKGFTVEKVILSPWYRTNMESGLFLQAIEGTRVENVHRIAKNIVMGLENELYVAVHLAMTGQLLLIKESAPIHKWERARFILTKDGKTQTLRFNDMRMFGKLQLLNLAQYKELKNKYGPEPLEEALTPQTLLENLQSKKTNIKNALLDQKLVAGLGNIYATDALFMSKIHPETKTQHLTLEKAKTLLDNARLILKEGIQNRGSTLADKMYVDVLGREGNQQNFFRIYGKSTCPTCKNKVEFKKLNGRGTYFCPQCQS